VNRTRNVLTIDVEDWPQSTLDASLQITPRARDNTFRLLDLLATTGVKATFFVLGLVAARFPDVVRRITADGHEVGSHGHAHRPVDRMTPEEFRADLRRSIAAIEDAGAGKVLGYRAPDFSISERSLWALTILAEEGLAYDSSLFPISGPRYGVRASFREPCRILCPAVSDFVEFPLPTIEWKGFRFPAAGGGYFRLFPYWVTRSAISRMNQAGTPATVYLHPYELDAQEFRSTSVPIPWRLRLTQGLMRSRVAPRLRRLLRDFSWGPAAAWLEDTNALVGERCLDLTLLPAGGNAVWRREQPGTASS
jgi:polysaccharide deacetylase family protein (PEP-CTERM system associated)